VGTVVGCSLKFMGTEGAAGFSNKLRISGISVVSIVIVVIVTFVILLKYSWKPGISTRVCCMLAAIVLGSKHNGRRSIVQVTKGGEGVLIAVIVVSIVIDIIGFCIGNKELSSASSVSLTIHCISVGAWGVGAMTEGLRIIVFPVVAVFKVVSIIVAIVIVFGCIV